MANCCPKGELPWVLIRDDKGVDRYLITSKPDRAFYFIYDMAVEKPVKLGKAKNPTELETKYVKL